MNAYYLHKPDGTKTDLHACGVCGKVARYEGNFDISARCCTCYDCGKPLDEGDRSFANRKLYHRACEDVRRSKVEADRLDKAELIEGYEGPVYADGYGHGSYGDGFFADVDEFREHFEDRYNVNENSEMPEFAHACKSRPVAALNIDDVLESHCEEAFENAVDHLNGVDELRKAVAAFNQLNAAVLSWEPDYKRKVRVRETERRAA